MGIKDNIDEKIVETVQKKKSVPLLPDDEEDGKELVIRIPKDTAKTTEIAVLASLIAVILIASAVAVIYFLYERRRQKKLQECFEKLGEEGKKKRGANDSIETRSADGRLQRNINTSRDRNANAAESAVKHRCCFCMCCPDQDVEPTLEEIWKQKKSKNKSGHNSAQQSLKLMGEGMHHMDQFQKFLEQSRSSAASYRQGSPNRPRRHHTSSYLKPTSSSPTPTHLKEFHSAPYGTDFCNSHVASDRQLRHCCKRCNTHCQSDSCRSQPSGPNGNASHVHNRRTQSLERYSQRQQSAKVHRHHPRHRSYQDQNQRPHEESPRGRHCNSSQNACTPRQSRYCTDRNSNQFSLSSCSKSPRKHSSESKKHHDQRASRYADPASRHIHRHHKQQISRKRLDRAYRSDERRRIQAFTHSTPNCPSSNHNHNSTSAHPRSCRTIPNTYYQEERSCCSYSDDPAHYRYGRLNVSQNYNCEDSDNAPSSRIYSQPSENVQNAERLDHQESDDQNKCSDAGTSAARSRRTRRICNPRWRPRRSEHAKPRSQTTCRGQNSETSSNSSSKETVNLTNKLFGLKLKSRKRPKTDSAQKYSLFRKRRRKESRPLLGGGISSDSEDTTFEASKGTEPVDSGYELSTSFLSESRRHVLDREPSTPLTETTGIPDEEKTDVALSLGQNAKSVRSSSSTVRSDRTEGSPMWLEDDIQKTTSSVSQSPCSLIVAESREDHSTLHFEAQDDLPDKQNWLGDLNTTHFACQSGQKLCTKLDPVHLRALSLGDDKQFRMLATRKWCEQQSKSLRKSLEIFPETSTCGKTDAYLPSCPFILPSQNDKNSLSEGCGRYEISKESRCRNELANACKMPRPTTSSDCQESYCQGELTNQRSFERDEDLSPTDSRDTRPLLSDENVMSNLVDVMSNQLLLSSYNTSENTPKFAHFKKACPTNSVGSDLDSDLYSGMFDNFITERATHCDRKQLFLTQDFAVTKETNANISANSEHAAHKNISSGQSNKSSEFQSCKVRKRLFAPEPRTSDEVTSSQNLAGNSGYLSTSVLPSCGFQGGELDGETRI